MKTSMTMLRLLCVLSLIGAVACGDDDGAAGASGSNGDASFDGSTDDADDDAQAGSSGDSGSGGNGGVGGEPPTCEDDDGDGYRAIGCGGDDCDDTQASVHPGASEICANDIDDDCNPATPDIRDNDNDGFGCDVDCNDAARMVNPARSEVCGNGIDDDCNPATPDIRDLDNDGFGCDVDCDDMSAAINPAADELCGTGVDEDCDATTTDSGDNDGDGIDCAYDCDDDNANLPDADHFCAGTLGYFEGFEHGPGGWTVSGVAPSWQHGVPAGSKIDRAASGDHAWVTGIDPVGHNHDEASYLTSPAFNFSSLDVDPVLRFARTFDLEDDYDTVLIELSTDDGATWTRLLGGPIDQNFYDDASLGFSGEAPWQTTVVRLTGAASHDGVRVRFGLTSDYSVSYEGFALDDVRITEEIFDMSIDSLTLPDARCGDRSQEQVTVVVTNRSSTTISTYDVAYTIDGSAPVVERFDAPLSPGQSAEIDLDALANLSAVGSHVVRARVSFTGAIDEVHANDATERRTHTFPRASLDYSEGFEQGEGGWTALGERSSWARGRPIGHPIDGAGEGMYAWRTNPYGVHNLNERSFLVSPCFDLSAIERDPILSFQHAYLVYGGAAHTVEIAIDGGPFQKLGTHDSAGANHWYNDEDEDVFNGASGEPGVWHSAHHPLTGAAQHENVQVRFALYASSTQAPGVGVDDIKIVGNFVDSQITGHTVGALQCAGVALPVAMTIFNGGSQPLTGLRVSYQLDNATPVVETLTTTIDPLDDLDYAFTTPLVINDNAQHTITLRTLAVGQARAEVAVASATFAMRPTVVATGYSNDFESSDGGWRSLGDNPWVRGQRSSVQSEIVTGAASGTRAWFTNLRGEYADYVNSFLESPCFDFSAVTTNPQVQLALIHDTEESYDGAWLEISTDGGATFTKLGTSATGTDWYNNASRQRWDGTSDPGQWRIARHPLTGVATQPRVFFRFGFTSDSSVSGEGFGIDDFAIVP